MKKGIIFLASDHAGFKLKEKIKNQLILNGKAIYDFGPHSFDSQDDYPDFIIPCAKKVAKTKDAIGIILGGSGQGEAIAANKIKGIRAATIYHYDKKAIKLSREHNNANMISLGARFLTEDQALEAVDLFLKTGFSNEQRHKRRLRKIE